MDIRFWSTGPAAEIMADPTEMLQTIVLRKDQNTGFAVYFQEGYISLSEAVHLVQSSGRAAMDLFKKSVQSSDDGRSVNLGSGVSLLISDKESHIDLVIPGPLVVRQLNPGTIDSSVN